MLVLVYVYSEATHLAIHACTGNCLMCYNSDFEDCFILYLIFQYTYLNPTTQSLFVGLKN